MVLYSARVIEPTLFPSWDAWLPWLESFFVLMGPRSSMDYCTPQLGPVTCGENPGVGSSSGNLGYVRSAWLYRLSWHGGKAWLLLSSMPGLSALLCLMPWSKMCYLRERRSFLLPCWVMNMGYKTGLSSHVGDLCERSFSFLGTSSTTRFLHQYGVSDFVRAI